MVIAQIWFIACGDRSGTSYFHVFVFALASAKMKTIRRKRSALPQTEIPTA
jgi:hypothetical protein